MEHIRVIIVDRVKDKSIIIVVVVGKEQDNHTIKVEEGIALDILAVMGRKSCNKRQDATNTIGKKDEEGRITALKEVEDIIGYSHLAKGE